MDRARRLYPVVVALLGVFLTVGIVGSPCGSFAAESFTIKAIDAWPLKLDCTTMFRKYVAEINSRTTATGRQVKINLLGGPEVVNAAEQFEAGRKGLVDIMHTEAGYFAGECLAGTIAQVLTTDHKRNREAIRETGALEIINEAYRRQSKVLIICTQMGGGVTSIS